MLSTCQACERELLKSCSGKTSSKEYKQQQQLKKDYQSFLAKYSQLFSSNSNATAILSSNNNNKSSPSMLKKTVSTSSLSFSTPSSSSSSTTSSSAASSSSSPSPQSQSSLSPAPGHDSDPPVLDQKFVLEAKPADLLNTISQVVTCIGCRTSVERFYRQLVQQQVQKCSAEHDPTVNVNVMACNTKVLDPIVVNSNGSLTLKQSLADRPASLYSLFYLNK